MKFKLLDHDNDAFTKLMKQIQNIDGIVTWLTWHRHYFVNISCVSPIITYYIEYQY